MAPRMGTSISTHSPILAHSPGRDGSCIGSLFPWKAAPHPKQGLVVMKPDLSPHYQQDIPCVPPP